MLPCPAIYSCGQQLGIYLKYSILPQVTCSLSVTMLSPCRINSPLGGTSGHAFDAGTDLRHSVARFCFATLFLLILI